MPVDDLSLLTDAAMAAGDIAKKYFRSDFDVVDKPGGQGPVTAADLEIDGMLKAELLAARPDFGWLSEETEDGVARLDTQKVFIVDPIDGTRAFVAGQKTFAHSLAIAENGTVVSAVVHLPMRELTYVAKVGHGAFLNGQRLELRSDQDIENAQILTAKPQLHPDLWPGGVPPVQPHFRSSLAYRLCLVAQGKFDGMITLKDAWEWDIAAGDLICREAGVVCTDKFGADLKFNVSSAKAAGVLAANPLIHAGLLHRLQP